MVEYFPKGKASEEKATKVQLHVSVLRIFFFFFFLQNIFETSATITVSKYTLVLYTMCGLLILSLCVMLSPRN